MVIGVNIKIDQGKCKGCDLCLNLCPMKVFQESNQMGSGGFKLRIPKLIDKCSRCGLCQFFCPEAAISIEDKNVLTELCPVIQPKLSGGRGGWRKSKSLHPGKHFIGGNTACAWAAIDAGCRFFAGYPITPATGQSYEMEQLLPRNGGIFIQMENEDSSLAAICGASLAGVKAMTATSDPGFERMLENLAFALSNEIPLVIAVVQRTSPSTGRPTGTGAWLVRGTRWGPHGGTEHIVVYPTNVQETYNQTIKAFNLSEIFRCTVIVLLEASNTRLLESIEIPQELDIFDRIYVPLEPPFGPTENKSAPSMPRFGDGELLKVTGLTHNQKGTPCPTDPGVHERMVTHQREKIISRAEELIDIDEYLLDDAEIILVAYGYTARSARWAVKEARRKGIKAGQLTLRTLYPFPERIIEKWSKKAKYVLVPEMNQGQLFYIVRESSFAPVISLPQPDGESIEPDRILHFLESMGEKYSQVIVADKSSTIYCPPEWAEKKELLSAENEGFNTRTPFCPGCGLGILRNCLLDSLRKTNIPPENIVIVSGIGCTARLCNHMPLDSANTTHGYSVPFATGVKLAKPDLHLVVVSGDGDLFNIGAGQTIHGAHRNLAMTVICFNNFVFGMTGGQAAVTTPYGAITSTTTSGNAKKPLDLISIMLAANVNYAARCPISKPAVLEKLLTGALIHENYSFIEVVSPCLTGYGKQNKISSPSNFWQKLNQAFIHKERIEGITRTEMLDKFNILFPFRTEVDDAELLQIVYGRFTNPGEYWDLSQRWIT